MEVIENTNMMSHIITCLKCQFINKVKNKVDLPPGHLTDLYNFLSTESETDIAVFCHYAQEDSELRPQCPRQTRDGERGPSGGGQPGRHTGSGICQTGSQDDVPPRMSPENSTPCKYWSKIFKRNFSWVNLKRRRKVESKRKS